jgi:hypothetical protein
MGRTSARAGGQASTRFDEAAAFARMIAVLSLRAKKELANSLPGVV